MRLPSARSTFLCLAAVSTPAWVAAQATDYSELPVSQILERANAFLAQGSGAEAVKLYSLAIDRDPAAYLTLYRRATTYLSMGQNARALEDFENVLRASDDFDQARLQIAKLHLKTGQFAKVGPPLDRYLKSHPSDAAARELKTSVAMLRKHTENAVRHHKAKAWDLCISAASTVLEQAAHSKEVRELRAECWLGQGGVEEAIADYTRALVLDSTSTTLSLRLSLLSTVFLSQPSETALSSLKQCLHHDPESKPCKTLHRLLRALEKDFHKAKNFIEASQWSRASPLLTREPSDGLIKRVEALIADYSSSSPPASLGISSPVLASGTDWTSKSAFLTTLYGWACKSHVSAGEIRTGSKYCEAVLKRDPENVDGLVGRGETLLKEENYESATRVLQDAFEKTARQDRNIMERLQRAQRLLKQSKQKDYYKVLGVARDADLKTIKKAFRKASLKAHPDKGGTEEKMAAVNEAYEVLGNPELRARFDNGDDPNDHAQQQNPFAHHQAGQMFQQFFFQQGGGFSGGGGGPRVQFQWNN